MWNISADQLGCFCFSQLNFRGLGVLQEMIYADETIDEFCCRCQLSYHFIQMVMGFAPTLCCAESESANI